MAAVLDPLRAAWQMYVVSARHSRRSYAQEGEDLAVDRLLGGPATGFYVEVGCHHPYRFSNTYLFYRRGWRGLCIDPLPGTRALFARHRPRDTVIEKGVAEQPGALNYYMFNEAALNTFDERTARERDGRDGYRIDRVVPVQTQTLASIIGEHAKGARIDFLSVDVEGLDLQVLRSNDWQKHRPKIVIAELLKSGLESLESDPVSAYLRSLGYRPQAKTGHSVLFTDT
jgi:FkbM family methyltransferase